MRQHTCVILFTGKVTRYWICITYILLQIPKRKGEYIYGVAPCLASLLARRRKIHKILMKKDLLAKDTTLKKSVHFVH